MANLQYYFFPTDFYYPRPSLKTRSNDDQRQVILPAENPNTGDNINEHGDEMIKDAADKKSSRVKATSFGVSFVPPNKQISGLHFRSDRVMFRGLMNAKLSRQVPDRYREDQIPYVL